MDNNQHNMSIENSSKDSEVYRPIVFYGISITRLVCLYILSLGFYRYYWFYKNWKAIKQAGAEEEDISPLWRSVFSIFFFHSLCIYIKESIAKNSTKKSFSATWLAIWYIIFHIIGSIIGVGFFKIFISVRVQRAILFNNAQIIPHYRPEEYFSNAEYMFIILGGLCWGYGILNALFARLL